MIQAPSRGIAATAALLVVGCGAEPRATGDWMGTVYDSVGVLVVDNPESGLWVRHAKHVSSLGPSDVEAFDVRAFGAPEYDVFDREGRFLGVIATPDRFQAMQADAEHVYGVLRDDLGVQRVVRLRVRR